MRIALGIEYDGSTYNGWQSQQHGLGVQQLVEKALSTVADQDIRVVCAGRTDSGVHALEQVVHFDTNAVREMRSWVFGANANLPGNVSVLWAKQVDDEFHARFSASARCYRYIILNRVVRPAINARRVTWEHRPLDVERMH
ncbi:MAG: tRNA pseudouridine synthase A, partial [Granulosicoccaceae bacterium]